MKRVVNSDTKLKIVLSLLVLVLFLGCKKEDACKNVVQGDFELVE